MVYAVMDIGSNSVRLLVHDGERVIEKKVITTRLAEGMSENFELTTEAMQRTVAALSFFCEMAKTFLVDKIFAFATAAVRRASNRAVFLELAEKICGVEIDVVSGEMEARLGYVGALGGRDGGLIDVGGASTEVTVINSGETVYAKSVDVGAVTVKDACGQNEAAVMEFVNKKTSGFGAVPIAEFCAIGGTATSVAAMMQELNEYSSIKVDGFVVEKHALISLRNKLFSMSVEERKSLKGLQPQRAEIIAGGVSILLSVMEKIGLDKITVSDKDNLEGYLKLKVGL